MTKRFFSLALAGLMTFGAFAQNEEGFVFTTVKENPITSIKNQNRAGTCWCYSSLSFIEAELLRMGKGEFDFSEMYIVHNTYLDRADKAVRTHGDISFSQGGSFYDVLYGMEKFGLVPESEMRPGVMYGDTLSNHNELTAVSDAVVAAIAKGKHRNLQTAVLALCDCSNNSITNRRKLVVNTQFLTVHYTWTHLSLGNETELLHTIDNIIERTAL